MLTILLTLLAQTTPGELDTELKRQELAIKQRQRDLLERELENMDRQNRLLESQSKRLREEQMRMENYGPQGGLTRDEI